MKLPRGRDRVPFSYRALQAWARIAVSVFYRRLDVSAVSRLPRDRPVILTANHGNALADVAVIIAGTPEFPHFLAAASWWKSAPARVLFGLGGVVPIHRRRDGEHTERNASSFAECHEALGSGASIAIFPEGEMHLEPALLPIKTGAARIALSAAAEAGLGGVTLVPLGLVYDDRGRFRSDAEIHFGEPVEIDDWVESYRTDPVQAVRDVTDLLADRLAQVTVNHGSAEEAAVLDHAAALALGDPPTAHEFARRNELRRALGSAVTRAGGKASAEYEGIVAALNVHKRDLERLGIDERDMFPLGSTPYRERVRVLVELVALTPAAVVGIVANAPTLLVLRLAGRRVPHEAWQATVKGVGGTFLSPIVWAVEFGFLSHYVGRRRALMLTTAGAAGGAVALVWRERLQHRRQSVRRDALHRADPAALQEAERSRMAVQQRVGSLVGRLPLVEAD
jgi:glycerol-3-phosphate O-acyltransferase/dihydroxyacetone phosphate acyltransferase